MTSQFATRFDNGDIERRRLNRARFSIGGDVLDDDSQVLDSAGEGGARTRDPGIMRRQSAPAEGIFKNFHCCDPFPPAVSSLVRP